MDYIVKIVIDGSQEYYTKPYDSTESVDWSEVTYISEPILKDSTSLSSALAFGGMASNALTFNMVNPDIEVLENSTVELFIKGADTGNLPQGNHRTDNGEFSIHTTPEEEEAPIIIGTDPDAVDIITYGENVIESSSEDVDTNPPDIVLPDVYEEGEVEEPVGETTSDDNPPDPFYDEETGGTAGETGTTALTAWSQIGGVFNIISVKQGNASNIITVECLDQIATLSASYYTPTTNDISASDMFTDLAEQMETYFGISAMCAVDIPSENITMPDNTSFRDALGYFAGLVGGFVTVSDYGSITIQPYDYSDAEIHSTDFIGTGFRQDSQSSIVINGITCDTAVGREEDLISVYDGGDAWFENPFMTEDILLNNVWVRVRNLEYYSGTLECKWNTSIRAGQITKIFTSEDDGRWNYLATQYAEASTSEERAEILAQMNACGRFIVNTNQTVDLVAGNTKISSLGLNVTQQGVRTDTVLTKKIQNSYSIASEAQASAEIASQAAEDALESAGEALESAESAQASANEAYTYAGNAMTSANNAQTSANNAQTSANNAQTSANNALASAHNANEYASRALGNLTTVQSVAETLTWVTQHGTMALTSDTSIDPTHVYFVVDANGDYIVGNTHYSIVTEPETSALNTYYELTIDESLNNYVGTHLALTSEGLWLLPATSGTNKVLIATGAGSTYTTAGTYLIDSNGGILASFRADGATINASGTQIAHLGYGPGNNSSGGTSNKPYYTLGERDALSTVGNYSIAEGVDTIASGWVSHAEGAETVASGSWSHSEGYMARATGNVSHAEGGMLTLGDTDYYTTASGRFSHAEGIGTTASGNRSHSEGAVTTASGNSSHAQGFLTTASGDYSHAEGEETTASGMSSHAQNCSTIAQGADQTAIGRYNIAQGVSNTVRATDLAFIIGNGTDDNSRSNALTVDWSGDVETAGGITASDDITTTGDVSGVNVSASGDVTVTGDVSADNITASGNATITGDVSADNVTASGNISSNGNVSVTGDIASNGNVTGTNLWGSQTADLFCSGQFGGLTILTGAKVCTHSATVGQETFAVSFGTTFKYLPNVQLTSRNARGNYIGDLTVAGLTTTGFNISIYSRESASHTYNISWFAIGERA